MSQQASEMVAIVDGYSTGAYLAKEFKRFGYECLHIQSRKKILEFDERSFCSEDYRENFIYDEDLDNLIESLRVYSVKAVVPGCESGVLLADRLSAELCLKGNLLKTSSVRRNKYLMAKTLSDHSVPHAQSYLVSHKDDLEKVFQCIDSLPVVLKPPHSAGADGIYFCQSLEELQNAFDKEFGTINEMGHNNDSLVVMEYLEGQQYKVQSVSIHGKHTVYEIWKDNRAPVEGAGVVNDYEELLTMGEEVVPQISQYIKRVLNAFGVMYGVSFSEVIITSRGPILVEMGSRMMGTQCIESISKVSGINTPRICAASYHSEEETIKSLNMRRQGRDILAVVGLISRQQGILVDDSWREELSTKCSLLKVLNPPRPGDQIRKTINFTTLAGLAYLSHPDRKVIERDYQWIRQKEASEQGFFKTT